MCGRYYVDDETAREIEKIVRNFERGAQSRKTGDVCPSQEAEVLCRRAGEIGVSHMLWGFPAHGNLIINARCESAVERRMFHDSILHRRCVIPARGFYEWNRRKEKYTFERQDADILFMAGCYSEFESCSRFVILTTAANASVRPVHERMPLILERNEVDPWISDNSAVEKILRKTPSVLDGKTEYEQMTFL